ncbi:hypothetical protein Clacol_002842 [Clathrus columnatus]|uniref:Uncharacterized protein n=1 Tax=Clathrus columnatus TaxID=1419009 RepID=A0AAV5A7K7_9AGAM|nr:hypothetical protein Clacol_002842 [Clathrus columnatus]
MPNSSVEQAQKTAQDAYAAASRQAGDAFKRLKTLGEPLANRFSSMLGSYREPLTYNLAVARELMKQVYTSERLQPPLSLRLWVDAYSTLSRRAQNPVYWREIIKSGQWAVVGLYSIEAYFIFKIGEIVGRRSLIGYKLE